MSRRPNPASSETRPPRDAAFDFPKGETPDGWTRTVLPEQEWYDVRLEEPFTHTHHTYKEGAPRYDW